MVVRELSDFSLQLFSKSKIIPKQKKKFTEIDK